MKCGEWLPYEYHNIDLKLIKSDEHKLVAHCLIYRVIYNDLVVNSVDEEKAKRDSDNLTVHA